MKMSKKALIATVVVVLGVAVFLVGGSNESKNVDSSSNISSKTKEKSSSEKDIAVKFSPKALEKATVNEKVISQEELLKDKKNIDITLNGQYINTSEIQGIIVEVVLKNTSKESVYLDIENAMTVDFMKAKGTQVMSLHKYKPKYYDHISDDLKENNTMINEIKLNSGVERKLSYFVETSDKGLYFLSFMLNDDVKVKNNDGKELGFVWFANKFIVVE